MLFNSLDFLFFFPIVIILYYVLPQRIRWFHLLLASCIFYMFFIPKYILILFVTILIDYFAGIYIEKSRNKQKKKILLIISILSTISVLIIFKYFNFFNSNLLGLAHFFHLYYPENIVKIILPVGLSFHTFQSLSYVIEVYRGNQKAQKHIGIYSLYVMFFPQLVAGLIERPQNLMPQFYQKHTFDYDSITTGMKLIAIGLFQKIVIADRLSIFVNNVYNNPQEHSGIVLIVATFFFAIQIYCDFSGYSNIAIGSAKVMGFKLMKNFNSPYLSKSIPEFWRRWHISLSTWFKDYLYIPLGGNKVSKLKKLRNIFIVFIVSGIWHGANWTFFIWGALHGVYYYIYKITKDIRQKLNIYLKLDPNVFSNKFINLIITFILVNFAWVFFRAKNLSDAFYISQNLIKIDLSDLFNQKLFQFGLSSEEFYIGIISIVLLLFFDIYERKNNFIKSIKQQNMLFRWSIYFFIILSIIFYGVYGENNNSEFIYFQF